MDISTTVAVAWLIVTEPCTAAALVVTHVSDGSMPVDLLQAGSLPGAGNDATLLGAPQPHGMAQLYGATLFGSK